MVIIEKFLKSKSGNLEDSEDSIFISEHFSAVIDGATSKTPTRYNDLTKGETVKNLLEDALKKLNPDSNVRNAVNFITKKVSDFYIKNKIMNLIVENPAEKLSAAIAIYSKIHKEVWIVGDCQCIIGERRHLNKNPIDGLLANTRSYYLSTLIAENKSIQQLQKFDEGREFIKPLLIKQYHFQNNLNSDFCYGAIDGTYVDSTLIKTYKVQEKQKVVLASDGYPKVFSTLDQTEKYLNFIIENDPLCFNIFKATKGVLNKNVSYDDRCYLKLEC